MGAIKRYVDKTVRVTARMTGLESYVDALRDARRSYSEKRDALDMDHLRVMLGFWLAVDSNCVDTSTTSRAPS